MSFLKKKEKPEKVLPEDATTFQKLWYNKQTHAAIVLGMYLVGIIILLLIINFMPAKQPLKTNEGLNETLFYEQMKEELKKALYNFEYDITVEKEDLNGKKEESFNVKYTGEKTKEALTGYKEIKDTIIKYELVDGVAYNTLVENSPEIKDFYENINPKYLDLNHIFTLIKPRAYDEEKTDNLIKYIYEEITLGEGDKTLNISVYIKGSSITQIDIVEKELFQKTENLTNEDFYIVESTYILKYTLIS